jgi:hypothetical protein
MPKVMPSQVVQTIDELFPHAKSGVGNGTLGSGHSSMLLGVINLVREIPNELLPFESDDYARLVLALSTIESHLEIWTVRGPHGHVTNVQGVDAITAIRRVLERCPDEYPPPATTELTFIADNQLRESIRADIGTANRALQNAEWKAATVIAGGAIEALLLWAIKQPKAQTNRATAIQNAVHSGDLPSNPPSQPEGWNLKQFIEVASHLNAIKPETKTAALLAKDFRNLIHPGRAARTCQKCNRATAMSTVAALEHVVNDLTP